MAHKTDIRCSDSNILNPKYRSSATKRQRNRAIRTAEPQKVSAQNKRAASRSAFKYKAD